MSIHLFLTIIVIPIEYGEEKSVFDLNMPCCTFIISQFLLHISDKIEQALLNQSLKLLGE